MGSTCSDGTNFSTAISLLDWLGRFLRSSSVMTTSSPSPRGRSPPTPVPTPWRRCSAGPAAELRPPALEERPLGRVRAELDRDPVCLRRLVEPAGSPQQVGPGGLVGVVALQPVYV